VQTFRINLGILDQDFLEDPDNPDGHDAELAFVKSILEDAGVSLGRFQAQFVGVEPDPQV
jgi:hypothetical protein